MQPSYWSQFPDLVANLDVRASTVRASDGYEMSVFELGPQAGKPVLIINPPASPFLLMSRVASILARQFRVISWETRGGPFLDFGANDCPVTSAKVAQDIVDIVLANDLQEDCNYVALCAGMTMVLDALDQLPFLPATIAVIAPPNDISEPGEAAGPFQTAFVPMMLELAQGRVADEEAFFESIQLVARSRRHTGSDDNLIAKLTGLNTCSLDAMKKYAGIVQNFVVTHDTSGKDGTDTYRELLSDAAKRVPIALLHSKDDPVVDVACSIDAYVRNGGIKLVLYPKGGHFMFFTHADAVSADISTFIEYSAALQQS